MVGWLGKSFIAMFCLIPFMLMFNFLGKNYGVRPEAAMFAWFLGSTIGIFAFSGVRSADITHTFLPILVIVALGIVIGGPSNILIAQAAPAAPNPALPFTIVNAASAVTFLLAPILAIALPRYFDPMSFSLINMSGIILVITGLGLVAYR